MRKAYLLLIPTILLFAGVAVSQISQGTYLPYKELIFPQVAAGGQYQTWVTVTNRGTQLWSGTFKFYTTQKIQNVLQSVPWNPVVNGIQISGGSLPIQLASKTTITYKITLPGSIQSGYLIATTSNITLDNFLEGNLTYYVMDSNGNISDAVGVMPSNPIFAAAIPFEDFSTLAIAFANATAQGKTATVTMKLYDTGTNTLVGTAPPTTLADGVQVAEYLRDAFSTVTNTSGPGRLEIESNVPVSMIPLSQTAGGQYSSLPLAATTRTYAITSTSAYVPFARMTLWTEGLFIEGYSTAAKYPDELFGLFGQIAADGSLHVHFDGNSPATGNIEIFGYMKSNESYTAGMTSFTGTYWIGAPSGVYADTGSFTATLVP